MMYTLAPINELLKALMTDDYHLSDQDPGSLSHSFWSLPPTNQCIIIYWFNGWMNDEWMDEFYVLFLFLKDYENFVIVFITSFSENKCFNKNKSEGQQLIKILIDLLDYEDDDLRLNSILWLYDKYQEENIFCDAQISYIVTPPSKQTFLRW